MTDERLKPEEFARLLSLPESHPDRIAAERSPEFAAMRALHAEFESETLPAAHRESVTAELAHRIAASRGGESGTVVAPSPERRIASRAPDRGGWFSWLLQPGGRVVFAFAALAVVAGLGWWGGRHANDPERIRGDAGTAFVSAQPVPSADGTELSWPAVAGADSYRIVFLAADLSELGQVDVAATRFILRTGDLPDGLDPAAVASFEVRALQQETVLATTPARALHLP